MADPRFDDSDLTHSQLQIWIGQTLEPTRPLYNMAFAIVFRGELDLERFRHAWSRVVDGSDALRTRVVLREGIPIRHVSEAGPGKIEVLDFRRHASPDDEFRVWCANRCAQPLPLDGPLVDSVIVRLGEDRTGWYVNQHHLVTDGWSTVQVFRQLAAQYDAGVGVAEPARQASYYSASAARVVTPAARRAARQHWASRRARSAAAVPLYGGDGRAAGTASTRLTLRLDRDRTSALDQLCAEEGFLSLSRDMSRFALFATLLLGWLHRVNGETELGFDTPVSGRSTRESRRSIGLFMEMFPFVVRIEPDDSCRSLGARCLDETRLFLRHAQPGTSAPSAATARGIVLNFFPESFPEVAGLPFVAEWVHPGHGDRVHALRLQVHDFSGTGRYTLHFDFNDAVLEDHTRRRAVEHFDRLITACLDDPDRPLAEIDLRTDAERRALVRMNAGAPVPWPDRSIVSLVEAQVQSTPDRVALRCGKDDLSFARLWQESGALAGTLVAQGVEPGDRVAITGRRSIPVMVGVLGVLRAGAAFVPVDPGLPMARARDMLEDADARVWLTGEATGPEDTGAGLRAVPILQLVEAGRHTEPPPWRPGLDQLAYLIYTSGSTGRPKGVLIEHVGLADYIGWASRHYVRGERLTFPWFTSLSFDLTLTSLFLPLVTGGTLEIYPEPEGAVDSALMDVVRANVVDFIKLTPSHLSLLRHVDLSGSRLRRIVVGGEDLKTVLAAAIRAQLGDRAEIYNEYGPTEAVVGCVAHRYSPDDDARASVPIGAPADHVLVRVLNDVGAPVPDGVPGELWIARCGIARGYHRQPDLTAERFRPDPGDPHRRWYRTGDLVRVAALGTLEFLGRLDRQLKLSGVRVEPAEIEAIALSHPMVEQCVVVARRPAAAAAVRPGPVRTCVRCGLSSDYPAATVDDDGVCSICRSYESIEDRAHDYFRTMDDLRAIFEESARHHRSPYDCMLLLSGGKDSTYALCRLVDMGLSVYAFTLDNGFISDGAKANMRRVTDQLGVPLEMASTPAMNAIFRDSLTRFSNVCQGCFKTIYTLSMSRAYEMSIPIIVTGLSRGQMFETRLTEDLFRGGRDVSDDVDRAVLEARKVYHRVDDEVARSLDVRLFEEDRVFESVRIVDFYRYCDAGLDGLLDYLGRAVPWVRPADTGRSTNCLINDVGIYIHKQERGYHNYALPYSWDVRLGQKSRRAAMAELDDQIDVDRVRRTLVEVGYDEGRLERDRHPTTLAAFYVATGDFPEDDLRRRFADQLPSSLVPTTLSRVDAIPLTPNGKLDENALPWPDRGTPTDTYRAPEGPVEGFLVDIWRTHLSLERVGTADDFFELGGTSLKAMDVMIRLCREFDIVLPLQTLFQHPTIARLARVAEDQILRDVAALDAGEEPRAGVDGPA